MGALVGIIETPWPPSCRDRPSNWRPSIQTALPMAGMIDTPKAPSKLVGNLSEGEAL